MRLVAVSTHALLATCGLLACNVESGTPSVPPMAQGGTVTSMTTPGSGGSSTTGPVNTTGGIPGNGGNRATGSAPGNGGTNATGGTPAIGGRATGGASTGGTVSGGGTSAKGGATATGGTSAKGGGTATGGTTAKGGTTATGGTSAKGGSTSTTGGTSAKGGNSSGGTSASGGAATGGRATGGAATGGAATGGAATGGSNSGGPTVTPLTNGTQGKTTRYWDCCKPSCGWTANAQAGGKSSPATSCDKSGANNVGVDTQSICSGGSAYQCNWGAPWDVSSTLSYGFAAYNGSNCGKCYQLDFTGTGDNAGAQSLKGKSMIVQAVNIGNIAANQFDLLIPGGGVGANNGCTNQWASGANLGATYGGFLSTCGTSTSCVTSMCQTAFGSNSSLMAGCNWFVGWFAAANNPGIVYAEVSCPSAITAKSGLK
jgi:hypothetical protein